jgi:hypothetical protein
MDDHTTPGNHGQSKGQATTDAGPGSETERFNAIVDPRNNEAVTGESGVPRKQRDHELRRQLSSLDEFS